MGAMHDHHMPLVEGAYRRKIKTAEELRAIAGDRPRDKIYVMCHGTFDLVHPGHIRHLLYAKSKGNKLIVSLTCDAHVDKANYRPYVPEELRAMNLAALEMTDYVVIDRNREPLPNLAIIQPEIFVKGYEYVQGGLHPKTAEEKAVVEGYGGEVIFTPGDIVFSSSAILESHAPDLAYDKLATLLDGERLGFKDLYEALNKVQGLSVHVVGDTIVDSLTRCEMIGANAKTPTFSVRYESRSDFVGGAGIVAKHMRAAGADVTFSTVLGEDDLKQYVIDDLGAAGVSVEAVIDPTRPTTNKNAYAAGGYRLLKVDRLDNRSISERIVGQLGADIAGTEAALTVFSDFRHGIFNRDTIPALTAAIPKGRFRVADSQVASRWGNILDFQGFDLITPNEREARFALADQDTVVRPLGSELYRRANCGVLILKLGPRGLLAFRRPIGRNDEDFRTFFAVDSFAGGVVDAVGSGDALLAYAAIALKATGNAVIAVILGNIAAGAECEIDGNEPVTPEIVRDKLSNIERQLRPH